MKSIILALCLIGSYLVLPAATIYVAHDATGGNNGTSWADAFTSLQDALDAADPTDADGIDQIWVKAGTYHPSVNVFGQPLNIDLFDPDNNVLQADLTFFIDQPVEIFGGFAGTESLVSERNISANPTILSGDFDPAIQSDNTNRVVWVQSTSGTLSNVEIDGFTITGGTDRGNVGGGGMYLNNVDPVELRNIVITDCSAADQGGGLFIYAPNVITIQDLTIQNCTSGFQGGGMYLQNNSSTAVLNIEGLRLLNNTAGSHGGGAYMRVLTQCSITNALIVGNTAGVGPDGGNGGGLDVRGQNSPGNISVTLTHTTFYGNTCADFGGATYTEVNAGLQMYNSIFYANSDGTGGTSSTSQIARVSSSINHIGHCLIQGSGGSGAGWQLRSIDDMGNNVDANPLFEDPDGADGILGNADDNFNLSVTSPANDIGTNSVPNLTAYPAFDLINANREQGVAPDLGAFEGPFGASFPVEWLSFEAAWESGQMGQEAALIWQTAQEIQSSHFIVERSTQQADNWAPIGQVEAAGFSHQIQRYTFTDASAVALPAGTRIYYRLRQIDLDGAHSYSSVVNLMRGTGNEAQMAIFPNPATDATRISLQFQEAPLSCQVNVRNVQGQVVWQKQVAGAASMDLSLPVAQLPMGYYWVDVQYDGKRQTNQIQVRH